MKSFTFLPRVILGLLLFVTGGGISLAKDVTNTVNGTTYTFKVTSTKDKTANVSLSKIDGTALVNYTGTDIDLKTAYHSGTYTSGDTVYTITSMETMDGNKTIKTVEMPSTVTSLPWSCFNKCTSLTSVSFPGIKTIGKYAFQNCSALTGISIPEGAKVGEGAFQYCTGLKGTLTIPNGANIAYKAFDGCSGITSIVLHSGMTSGEHDRNGCFMSMSGVKSVSIKYDDGKNTIPANVFGGASFSKDVTLEIDKDITGIGDGAFYSANFPKTLDLSKFKSFGTYAFANNKTITGNNGVVTFADNAKFTGEQTFLNCTALSGTLTIPNGANIPYRAFDGCSGIESIVLHSGMTSREFNHKGCFMNMSKVSSVTIKDDGNNTIPANVFGGASFKDGVTLEIDKDITGIGNYAFYNANFPTTLDLSKFTSYGASAFENNKVFQGNDQKVIAVKPSGENSVTVGSRAFWNTQATEVDVDPNVTYSGCENYGPYNGSNITTIKFNSNITDIPAYVFNNATDILEGCTVSWPKTVGNIGAKAFCGVKFSAAIPSAMTGTIGASAYAGNSISGPITIPDGCKGIGEKAFDNCDKITGVTVPATTTSIGESAFAECDLLAALNFATLTDGTEPNLVLEGSIIDNDPKMTGITITNAVKTIYYSSSNSSNNTFSGLYSPFTVTLKSDKVTATERSVPGGTFFSFKKNDKNTPPYTLNVVVADGVTTIPANMFSENSSGNRTNSNINVLNISGSSLTEIKPGAFQNNQELTSVDLSGAPKLKKIDSKAFSNCSMTSINFGTNCDIDTIGTSAFESCKSLDSITIGKVKTLGDYAFNNCSSLAKINQASDGKNDLRSSTLTRIGRYTFGGCSALENLYLPSTLMRINAAAFTNGEGKVAEAASDDMVFIKADIPFGITTFSRGFGVKYNSKDNADKLAINDTIYNVWIPTSIDTKTGTLVLQQYTGTQVLSDEVEASVQEAGTETSYSKQPVGFLLIQKGWKQITPTDLKGDAVKAGTGSVNMRVLISSGTVQKSWANDDFSKVSLMRGVIDPVNIKDVTDKYVISKRDLALHVMSSNGTFPAGRAYIYAPTPTGSGAKGFTLFYSDEPLSNTTTGINKGVTEVNKDRMADDSYYDLSGRKVNSPTEGIYIHHGRKVVIKRM